MNQKEIITAFANLLQGIETKLTLQQAFENMIIYSKAKECRKGTIDYYTKTFSKINEYMKSVNIIYVEDINKMIVSNMIIYLKAKDFKNSSINKYIEVLKHIVKFNYDNDYTKVNNIATIKKLKEKEPDIKTIEEKNVIKILNYIEELDTSNLINLRFKVFIKLLMDTGARYNEIVNIKLKNIDIDNNSILLDFTKTNKDRYVFFSDHTKQDLEKLKRNLENLNQNLENLNRFIYLFSNFETKKIIFKSTMYEQIENMRKKLEIEQSITPHKWRHTLATKLCDNNINLMSIKEVLGHSTLEITKRYIHADKEKIKKDVLNVL